MLNKIFISTVYLLLLNINAYSQANDCSNIPLSFNTPVFTTAVPLSFGDSMITFTITNNHPTQGFAYPLAKLVPLNSLPAGMTPANNNNPWSVFASSWNPGITMPVYYYYDLTLPIPVNYTVTFQLWISNLSPVISDSCLFSNTFTMNLNPATATAHADENEVEWKIISNNEQHETEISWQKELKDPLTISLFDVAGSKILETEAVTGSTQKILNTGRLSHGIYFIFLEGNLPDKIIKKIVL